MPKEKGTEERTKRRNRSENFTEEEVEAMIKEVVARKDIIENPVTASLTHKMKQTAWEHIADASCKVSGIPRSVKEMRVKLTNLKSKVKRDYIERRRLMQQKGSDYTPPELPLWETLLLEFIGEEALNGIEGIQNLLTSQWLDMEEEEPGAGATMEGVATTRMEEHSGAAWTASNSQRGSNTAFNRMPSQKRTYQEMHEYDEDSVSPEWIEEEKFHVENERLAQVGVGREQDCLQTGEGQFLQTNDARQTRDGLEIERERLEDAEARLNMEKQKFREERERLAMERERLKLDDEKIGVERAKIEVEREKLEVEKERVRLQKEKLLLLEGHQTKMENIAMERLNLERQRTEMLKNYLDSLDSKPDPVHLASVI